VGTTLTTQEAGRIFSKLKMKEKRNGYHVRGYFFHEGKAIAVAQYSHGNKELPGKIPIRFRESLYLDDQEFRTLKRCHLTFDDYLGILVKKGKIK
jgi:uncharacterized membrane-anchored protein